MTSTIINSSILIASVLDHLENQPVDPPSLYLDIEGVALSRYGSISIIQLFHLPQKHVFLIDVFVLQEVAFSTANQSGTTLRSILESASIPKVFFDVRNDADALFAHFNVVLRGVHDVQLLELATRSRPKHRVAGLGHCIKNDVRLPATAQKQYIATKDRGKALFAPEDGGTYQVFNVRPIPQDIINYCAQDVQYLPTLWKAYSQKIGKQWLKRVQDETERRVLMSQDESYVPHGKDKTLSPWISAVKHGEKKIFSGGIGLKEKERKEHFNVESAKKRKDLVIIKVGSADLVKQGAEKQHRGELSHQSPLGDTELQAPKHTSERIPAQMTSIITETVNEHSSSNETPSAQGKNILRGKLIAKADLEGIPAATNSPWICTVCDRKMLKTQEQDHLAGKAHIARIKQGAASHPPPQPTLDKMKSLQAASATTERSQKAKAEPATKSQQKGSGKVSSKSGKRRNGASRTSMPLFSRAYSQSDWGFVGFQQNLSPVSSAHDQHGFGDSYDYGLCDKDCGWCGHCMDNVDI